YFWFEAEQWTDEKKRISTPEITDLLKSRKLLLAFASEQLAGVVKIEKIDPKTAGFGMLAADPNGLQRGAGKALVGAAEAWPLRKGSAKWRSKLFAPKTRTAIGSYYMIGTQD
ncbi:MAG: GNAT family N-acetyltransferase, partial [Pseudomonadota bacterium]|nr:GNAT family N-acetyltransferase [Pseudomonadota bacterium]